MSDQYQFWTEALANGAKVEFVPGQVRAGFYRVRDRNPDRSIRWDAVSFWYDDDGLQCARTGRAAPTHADEIEALFASCNANPISYETYQSIMVGGSWPDQVAPVDLAEPEANSPAKTPDHALAEELAALQSQAKDWLRTLGHKPASQSEADKAANFGDAFAKIERRADQTRVAEKEPHLEAGRAVDAKFKPIVEGAATAKKWAKGLSDDFAKAESARRAEEARLANEKAQAEYAEAKRNADAEAARSAELAAKGVRAPDFAPSLPEPPKEIVPEAVKIGTSGRRQSLRKVEVLELESASLLLRWLSERNMHSEALKDAALAEARLLHKTGVAVPGTKIVVKEEIR